MKPAYDTHMKTARLIILALTLLSFGLRVFRLHELPPGWRDDELINSLVISQKALDGDFAVYYPDASGHEALYHLLNAGMLGLFGPGMLGIRLLSVMLGSMAVPAVYALGRRLFGSVVGLLAAAGLSLSFWSLMYSRIGLRHILMPLLALATFYFFWQGSLGSKGERQDKGSSGSFLLSALFMGLGFYTYFASRGVPLILLAFCGYLWLFHRTAFKQHWRGMLLTFGTAFLLALPLLLVLRQQPESEARVAELAVPVVAARTGDFAPLIEHVVTTLSMFHSDGDGEWLYNIPHRPVFGAVGAIFFWTGIAIALWHAFRPAAAWAQGLLSKGHRLPAEPSNLSSASALLLLWWLAGISPGFISVPPASLGHTIIAQPAVYIIAALPLGLLARARTLKGRQQLALMILASALLLFGIGGRDLPDYFQEWPSRGMVQFLYRANIHEVASYLERQPALADFGITGLLAGPWDKLALETDLGETKSNQFRPRWYNPARAILLQPELSFSGFPKIDSPYAAAYTPLPGSGEIGGYQLNRAEMRLDSSEQVCFVNGLCWLSAVYDQAEARLELGWTAARPLDLPPMPLISNPPPPGIYAGPRLLVFGQLLDADGGFIAGDDGLWVDPATLQAGDIFLQQHQLAAPEGSAAAFAAFGLYDPMTGERILTADGRDHLRIEIKD